MMKPICYLAYGGRDRARCEADVAFPSALSEAVSADREGGRRVQILGLIKEYRI